MVKGFCYIRSAFSRIRMVLSIVPLFIFACVLTTVILWIWILSTPYININRSLTIASTIALPILQVILQCNRDIASELLQMQIAMRRPQEPAVGTCAGCENYQIAMLQYATRHFTMLLYTRTLRAYQKILRRSLIDNFKYTGNSYWLNCLNCLSLLLSSQRLRTYTSAKANIYIEVTR